MNRIGIAIVVLIFVLILGMGVLSSAVENEKLLCVDMAYDDESTEVRPDIEEYCDKVAWKRILCQPTFLFSSP